MRLGVVLLVCILLSSEQEDGRMMRVLVALWAFA
jgi:hypothetical protein